MANISIPPGFAHVAFSVSNTTVGHKCVWTAGVKLVDGTWTPGQGSAFFNAVSAALSPIWDANVTQTGFHALIGSDGPFQALDQPGNVPGTLAPTPMAPPQVSYLFKKSTIYAGRRYRGRMYLPFVDTTFLSEGGVLSGTTATRLVTAAAALFNAPGTGSTTGVDDWCLLHRGEGSAPVPAPTIVTAISPTFTVATQRRRLER